jgi:hypothetical protein
MEKKLNSTIRIVAVALVAATTFNGPVLADRALSGPEAKNLLAGRQFDFICVDGTRGRANYHQGGGAATAVFRVPTSRDDAMEQQDQGLVRTTGDDVCIRWQRLNDGQEGCYRMTERKPGLYRIATNDQARWCDLDLLRQ